MSDDYKKLVYERAVWDHLLEQMETKMICEDVDPPVIIMCDELPFKDRRVPQDPIQAVAITITRTIRQLTQEIEGFSMQRSNDGLRIQSKAGPVGTPDKPAAKPIEGGKQPVERPSGKKPGAGGKGRAARGPAGKGS